VGVSKRLLTVVQAVVKNVKQKRRSDEECFRTGLQALKGDPDVLTKIKEAEALL
jgi:hypothetical protein